MKKNYLLLNSIIILMIASFISCNKEVSSNQELINKSNASIDSVDTPEQDPPEKVIFMIAVDEWGRASKDCNSWGLCNLRACVGCCIDENYNIVDYESNQSIPNSGFIEFFPDLGAGNLIIELDPQDSQQANAISNQLIMYVDYNLTIEDYTVVAGQYNYNAQIGDYGGYECDVIPAEQ